MSLIDQQDWEIHQLIREMCGGNTDPAQWLTSLLALSNVVDHIADGDFVNRDHAVLAITDAAVSWGVNPFYAAHAKTLCASVMCALTAWEHSDADAKLRCKAFDILTEVGTCVAFLVGGPKHAREWSPKLRAWAFGKMIENDSRARS